MIIERNIAPTLYNEIKFVSLAMSTDETRYFLCGLFVEEKEGRFRIVATDGKRLHMITKKEPFLLVTPGIWKIKVTPNEIIFLREIEGQFPNYKRVIPAGEPEGSFLMDLPCRKEKKSIYRFSWGYFQLCKTGKVFNIDYFQDLQGFSWKASIYPYGKGAYIARFDDDIRTALITSFTEDLSNLGFIKGNLLKDTALIKEEKQ